MLDKKVVHNYPEKIVIEEKRAPTDQSVAILREMENEAKNQILKSFGFGAENAVSGSVIYVDSNPRSAQLSVVAIFNINNKEHRVETKIDRLDLRISARDAYSKLIDAIAAEISLSLSNGLGVELLKFVEK